MKDSEEKTIEKAGETAADTGTEIAEETVYSLKIFASMHADAKDRVVFDPAGGITEEYIKEHAECYVSYPECEGHRILALSTCSEGNQTTRILVFAYLTE